MKEYIENGGKLFFIVTINVFRDGGTREIITSDGDFYVPKDYKTFHHSYPTNSENLVNDPLLITYLIDRIEKYNRTCEDEIERNKIMLLKLKQNNEKIGC